MGRYAGLTLPALLAALLLSACGGGGGNSGNGGTGGSGGSVSQATTNAASHEPNAPQATGDTATDGLAWFNFRRQQIGLPAFARNARIDAAALGHSNYQKINDVITHDQEAGKPGFTGQTTSERLNAAGYTLPPSNYAYGEVISSTSDPSGFHAAESLIAAIYHRFLVFEPSFLEAGGGAAAVAGGSTYFTANFGVIGLEVRDANTQQIKTVGLPDGQVALYPFAGQQNVPIRFFSDNEEPDPMPEQGVNEVGYPVSIQANITSMLRVDSFTIRARGGAELPVRLLAGVANPALPAMAVDAFTPPSGAAIIPLRPLASRTTYDVQFAGTVVVAVAGDKVVGLPVSRSWSFTTQ